MGLGDVQPASELDGKRASRAPTRADLVDSNRASKCLRAVPQLAIIGTCDGGLMTTTPEFQSKLGLADFLSDLRAELDEATKRAEGGTLKLEIDQITLSLDVAFTLGRKGEGSAKAGAKFWVFASAEEA